MKKLLAVLATAIGASIIKKNLDRKRAEQDLWSEATGTKPEATPAAPSAPSNPSTPSDAWASASDAADNN